MLVNKSHPWLWSSFLKGDVMSYHWDCHQCFVNFPMCFLKASSSTCSGSEEFFDPTADASCMNTYTSETTSLRETELAAAAGDCDSAAPGARGSPDEPECFHAAWVFRCCPQDASWCSLSPQTPVSTWVSVFAVVLLQKVAMGTESWPLGAPQG